MRVQSWSHSSEFLKSRSWSQSFGFGLKCFAFIKLKAKPEQLHTHVSSVAFEWALIFKGQPQTSCSPVGLEKVHRLASLGLPDTRLCIGPAAVKSRGFSQYSGSMDLKLNLLESELSSTRIGFLLNSLLYTLHLNRVYHLHDWNRNEIVSLQNVRLLTWVRSQFQISEFQSRRGNLLIDKKSYHWR